MAHRKIVQCPDEPVLYWVVWDTDRFSFVVHLRALRTWLVRKNVIGLGFGLKSRNLSPTNLLQRLSWVKFVNLSSARNQTEYWPREAIVVAFGSKTKQCYWQHGAIIPLIRGKRCRLARKALTLKSDRCFVIFVRKNWPTIHYWLQHAGWIR